MQSLLIIFILVSVNAGTTSIRNHKTFEHTNQCKNMVIKKVNNFYYMKDAPINLTGVPSDISVHWRTGRIFFTLISEDYSKMKLQVLKNGNLDTIQMDSIGQSTTVDNRNDIIYLATDNGVYKYNNDRTVTLYTATGEDVMYIATSNDGNRLFIATWPQNRVHVITQNGSKQETFPLIPNGHDLTVDNRNNMYFVAAKTSYILQTEHTIPIKIKDLPVDKMTGIFVSRSGKVYGMDEVGNLYQIDPDNAKATLLGSFDVESVNAFALDASDNVIIGVKGAIFKFMKMENSPCPEYEESM